MSNEIAAQRHTEYLHADVTRRIIKSAYSVHNELGPGFREIIYQRALALELPGNALEFSREEWIPVHYQDQRIGRFRVDFIIEEVMVEIKARSELDEVALIQTLSYLKASKFEVGLILNFGARSLQFKRLINSRRKENAN